MVEYATGDCRRERHEMPGDDRPVFLRPVGHRAEPGARLPTMLIDIGHRSLSSTLLPILPTL